MNIFHSILHILLIQICECQLLTSSWSTRAYYSDTSCDFFLGFFFQSDRPTQYQETHSTVNEEKKGDGLSQEYSRYLCTNTQVHKISPKNNQAGKDEQLGQASQFSFKFF